MPQIGRPASPDKALPSQPRPITALDGVIHAHRAAARARAAVEAAELDRHGVELESAIATAQAAASLSERASGGGLVAGGSSVLPAVRNGRVDNPKIWAADVRRIRRRFNPEIWLRRLRAHARVRERGKVRAPAMVRVGELLVWAMAKGGQGFARITHDSLASAAGCCPETIRKAIRYLERAGFLDTFNVLSRGPSWVRRDANLYLLVGADEAETPAPSTASARLTRWAPVFGLLARPWGLNATPARPRPAPA